MKARRSALRETATGYLLLGPSIVLIGAFGVFPFFFTVWVSLFKWRLARGPFAGIANYARLFGSGWLDLMAVTGSIAALVVSGILLGRRGGRGKARRLVPGLSLLLLSLAGIAFFFPGLARQGDTELFDSLRVTLWYCIGTVPVQLVAGLALAMLLTRRFRGRQAFRVMYLVPYIAPTVASAAVFQLLFSLRPDSFANLLVRPFGIGPLEWLQESRGVIGLLAGAGVPAPAQAGAMAAYWSGWAQGPSLALVSIMLYSWWVFVGYYALVYINGLNAIPRQLYEAAEVDGAGMLRRFFSITVPLLSPTTFFLTILGVIGTFKAFTHIYVLRQPSALGTTDPVSVEIFFTFFRKANMGYASAMSVLLFLIVLGLTLVQQRLMAGGVTYGD